MILAFINDKERSNLWLVDITHLCHIKLHKSFLDKINEPSIYPKDENFTPYFKTSRDLIFIPKLYEKR